MWYINEKGDQLTVVSIPLTSVVMFLGGSLIQLIVLAVLYEGILNGTAFEIFGYGIFGKILSAFAFSIPIFAICFFYLLIPAIRLDIDRVSKTLRIGKVNPFSNYRKIGFEFIKENGCITDFDAESLAERGLFLELDSGERIRLTADSSFSNTKTLYVADKIRKHISVSAVPGN